MDAALWGLIGVLAGGLLTFVGEEYRRRQTDTATRRKERVVAYQEFLAEAHMAAHLIGRASVVPGSVAEMERGAIPLTDAKDRDAAFARVDDSVARRVFTLEIVGNVAAVGEASNVRWALAELRDQVRSGKAPYNTTNYKSALRPYQEARKRFIDLVRAETGAAPLNRDQPKPRSDTPAESTPSDVSGSDADGITNVRRVDRRRVSCSRRRRRRGWTRRRRPHGRPGPGGRRGGRPTAVAALAGDGGAQAGN